jgi:hypothetical protein
LLLGNVLVIFTASILLTPKIEQHTQAAAINFFESKENEKCYIFVTGYKSYASYFYAKVKPLRYTDGLNLLNEKFILSKGKKSFLALTDIEKEAYDDNQKYYGCCMRLLTVLSISSQNRTTERDLKKKLQSQNSGTKTVLSYTKGNKKSRFAAAKRDFNSIDLLKLV